MMFFDIRLVQSTRQRANNWGQASGFGAPPQIYSQPEGIGGGEIYGKVSGWFGGWMDR